MRYVITLLVFLNFYSSIYSQDSKRFVLPQDVIESIENRIENGANPSVAIALIDESGTSYFNFGKTKTDGKEVDEHSIYEIGSISKTFTAVLLAQQVLDKDLELTTEVNALLSPTLEIPTLGKGQVTLGSLSDHTSGLPAMPDNFNPKDPTNPYADYSVDQMYSFLRSYEPAREVGSAYEYSNLAQGLLGHILAEQKEMSYEDLMINVIAEPLGMGETKLVFSPEMMTNLAYGHSGGEEVSNWDIPTLAGAGAIRSSTADMSKYIMANLGYVDSSLKEAMELSHEVRHSKAGEMSVGLGWHIRKGSQGDVIWHNGGTGGYRAFAGFVKETGRGVVILTNSSESVDDLGFRLLDPALELSKVKTTSDAVKVSEAILASYVGEYELQPGFSITITQQGDQLFGQATGQSQFELFAQSETRFFLTLVKAEISFQLEDSEVKSLTLFQGGQEILAKKIK